MNDKTLLTISVGSTLTVIVMIGVFIFSQSSLVKNKLSDNAQTDVTSEEESSNEEMQEPEVFVVGIGTPATTDDEGCQDTFTITSNTKCKSITPKNTTVNPGDVVTFSLVGETTNPSPFTNGAYSINGAAATTLSNPTVAGNLTTYTFSYTTPTTASSNIIIQGSVVHPKGTFAGDDCKATISFNEPKFTCESINMTKTPTRTNREIAARCQASQTQDGTATKAQFKILKVEGQTGTTVAGSEQEKSVSASGLSELYQFTLPTSIEDGDYKIQCRMCETPTLCTEWGQSIVMPQN